MKRRRICHIYVNLEVELFGHELPQPAAISVLHPPIGTDESQPSALNKTLQGSFDERNVQVRPVIDRFIPLAVFGHECVGDELLANIWRVADDEIEVAGQRGQQKIAVNEPLLGEFLSHVRTDGVVGKQTDYPRACPMERVSVELDGADAVPQRAHVAGSGDLPRMKQAFQSSDQEVTTTEGRFQQAPVKKRLIARVPGQIQDEIDNFAFCENGSPFFDTRDRETGDGFRHGALVKERLLADNQGFRLH